MYFSRSERRRLLRFYNRVSNVSRCRIADAAAHLAAAYEIPGNDTDIRFCRFSSPPGGLSMNDFPGTVQVATEMLKDDLAELETTSGAEEVFADRMSRLRTILDETTSPRTTMPRNSPTPAMPAPVFCIPNLDLDEMDWGTTLDYYSA